MFSFGLSSLLFIHLTHGRLVEQTDIQEFFILAATKYYSKMPRRLPTKSSCISSRTFADSSVWLMALNGIARRVRPSSNPASQVDIVELAITQSITVLKYVFISLMSRPFDA